MTKVMEKYSSYKDSGVKWLGEIPSHWETKRLNSFGIFSKGGGISRDELQEEGKSAILYGDIYTKYDIYADTILNHISEEVAAKSVRVFCGDILMTGSGETKEDIGKTVVVREQEAYIGGDVILFRQNTNNSSFLSYALNSQYAKDFRYRESKGEIIVHIYANNIKQMYLPLPPLSEQDAIVSYLDTVTSQIDAAIAQQQKMIELLNERKQIIINNAVTKGLDPNVKMKDSGVEWIGEIPEGWEVRRLKTILHTKDKRNSDPNALLLSVYTAIGVRPRQELEERGNKASTVINYKIVNKGDLIVNRLLAWMGAYGLSDYNGVTSPDYDVYSFQGKVNIHYYETLFRNTQFKSDCYKYGHGIMMMRWRTYSDEFLSINVPIPPKEEQDAIYDYLRPQIKKITEGVYQCEQQIALLQERKQIIINEVVTGKVKVV